ncbi:MAG: phage portal protein [Pseudomonadota bacterium]
MGMWWFGRKSAPGTARPYVPSWLTPGLCAADAGEGFARSYEAQYDEVFRKNPVGQRAVRLVAGMLGSLTIDAAGDGAGDGRALGLIRSEGLLESVAASLLLGGNAYVQAVSEDGDSPSELIALRPERMSVIADDRGWPVGYIYKVAGDPLRIAQSDPFGRRQMAHIKALNPRDDHYGMGCLEAACAPATVHNQAAKWNKSLLDNAARPSGALTYDPADGSVLSAEQFKRLKEELIEQFSGGMNAGRPLLLEGGLRWQALSLTPADMDFVALKEGAARDIALAFGVPPVLVGLPGDATYANAREAGRALYRQTILPLAGRILDGLGALLSTWLGPVAFAVDTDQLSELAEDRSLLWQMVNGAAFLSESEKREMLGFPAERAEQ